jgi:hypothetical protein
MKTICALAVITIAVLGGGWYFLNQPRENTQTTPAEDYITQAKAYIQDEQSKQDALVEAYKNDPYGGTTPEETLQLYIEALEKGDIDMAVNLFAVEDRERAQNSFSHAKYMKEYVEHLKFDHRIIESASGVSEVGIEFLKKDEQLHYERMKLNSFSGKWKLTHRTS